MNCDPQMSPWAREKNLNALSAALAAFSDADLGAVLSSALLQRFGGHEAANILARADRIVKGRP